MIDIVRSVLKKKNADNKFSLKGEMIVLSPGARYFSHKTSASLLEASFTSINNCSMILIC
jgi:hypothetical protein